MTSPTDIPGRPHFIKWPRGSTVSESGVHGATFRLVVELAKRVAHGFITNRDDAEEIAQEVVTTIFERRQESDPWFLENPGALTSYMKSAMRGMWTDRYRRAIAHAKSEMEFAITTVVARHGEMMPDRVLETKQLDEAMAWALDSLSQRDRLLFSAVRDQGLTYAEVAEDNDVTIRVVERAVRKGLKRLQLALSDIAPMEG